jgi:hypothetical protein
LNPVAAGPPPEREQERFFAKLQKWVKRIPLILALTIFVPIGIVAFFVNSAIQTVRSSRRVKLHEKGLAGIDIKPFRVNLWINEIRGAVEDAFENLNSSQRQEYIGLSDDDNDREGDEEAAADSDSDDSSEQIMALERKMSHPGQPTLALAPYQFSAIQALDRLKWRKYPVWIHKARHSHAAIIVRMGKPDFSEGKVVLKHWVKEEFLS